MKYKIGLMLLAVTLMVNQASAKDKNWFNPEISVFSGYAMIGNTEVVHSGIFDIKNRKADFGISLINRCYVGKQYFVNIGFRYNNFQTEIVGLNQFSDRFDLPYPFRWVKRYESVVVPVHFGKIFGTRQNCFVYAGLSAGILMSSYEMGEVAYDSPRSANNFEELHGTMRTDGALPNSFYLTGDLGINFFPIKKLPNFGVGLQYSLQLNQTSFQNNFTGMVTNVTTNETYSYNMSLRQRFSGLNIVLSYAFTTKRKKKRTPLACSDF